MSLISRLRTSAASPSPARTDALISAAVGVVVIAATWVADIEPWRKAAGTALAAGIGVALLGRRRIPVITGAAVGGLVTVHEVAVREGGGLLVAPLLIAFYSVGAYAGWPGSLLGFGLTYGAIVLGLFADPNIRNVPENALFVLLVAGAAWVSGRAVRASRMRSVELADLAAQLERERDENAQLAVAAERGRIARELHDVVAHGISVIAVQAGAGRHALGSDPRRAHAAFAAIEDTARQALVEMRHMLGLLREPGQLTTPAPLPGLADHGALIEKARADGVPVEIEVEGELRSLPPGVDLTAYRILQEALTNIRKHAPGAPTRVRIRHARGELQIEVQNDGAHVGSGAGTTGGGHGLIGMRERVALYGGKLEAESLAEGGFRVRARVPFDPGPA